MRRPASHSISDEFDRRNLFLCAVLGMISELRAVRRATRARARPALVLRAPDDEVRGDEALHAVLGVLSLSHTLGAHAPTVAGAARDRRAATPGHARRGSLRSLLV